MIPLLESMLGEMVTARTWFGILMSVVGISMLECSGSPPNVSNQLNMKNLISNCEFCILCYLINMYVC